MRALIDRENLKVTILKGEEYDEREEDLIFI